MEEREREQEREVGREERNGRRKRVRRVGTGGGDVSGVVTMLVIRG